MKKDTGVNYRKRLVKFGRKNLCCRILVIPILAFHTFLSHMVSYCGNNGKRFVMLSMTFLLFAVYSSFSFPMFVTSTQKTPEELYLDSQAAQNVSLAQETEISLEDVEILEDEDVLEGNEQTEISHGMSVVDKYDANEILESTQERKQSLGGTQFPGEGTDDAPEKTDDGKNVFTKDDWRLVLINKQHSIPEDYTFNLGTIKGNMQCDERIIDDLLDMLQAAKKDQVDLMICSPYRDLEYQKMLFNRKIERYMNKGMSYMEAYQLSSQAVTVPGASEHQIGLALDIVCGTYMSLDEGFGDTEAGKWLAENSCKYGFILRYPEGKEYITGIEYEPWHFRYVGVEAATVITGQEITLEEFWEEYLNNV